MDPDLWGEYVAAMRASKEAGEAEEAARSALSAATHAKIDADRRTHAALQAIADAASDEVAGALDEPVPA